MDSTKRQARVAGLLYLLACITAPFSLIYVPRTLVVVGDATATASHVRASTTLLRLAIANELFVSIAMIFALLALYRLFKSVNQPRAVLMAVLLLISIPVSLLNVLNDIAPLSLVSGAGFLSGFQPNQLDALVYVFLRLHSSFASLLMPQYARLASLIALVLELGELPIILWLLIWGAKEQPIAIHIPEDA